MKVLADSRIGEFCKLVNQGIEAWVEAGKLLHAMRLDTPNIFAEIIVSNPHLTSDILESFERIGRKEIYPYLIVDGSPGARKLALLPYESQERLYHGQITVVVQTQSGFEKRTKRVSELTNIEATLVFDGDKLRHVKEQTAMLRIAARKKRTHVVRAEYVYEEHSTNGSSLTEKPIDELARLLNTAQEAMLEARTALALLNRDSHGDLHITNALREIGSLRFKLANSEL